MRTITLTHEQIEAILHSLGIAERTFTELHRDITERTISVRNGCTKTDKSYALFYHYKSREFSNLNSSLSEGELDV